MLASHSIRPVILAAGLLALLPMQAQAKNLRIMPLGDSITQGVDGQCSYRRALSQRLNAVGDHDIEFVGPRQRPAGSPVTCRATDTDHAGFSGRRADEFTDELISELMSAHEPDRVLIHLGSNDIFQGQSVQSTVDDIDRVITAILFERPGAVALLANVIPWNLNQRNGSDNPSAGDLALGSELSSALEALAGQRIREGDAVRLVDVNSGFQPLIHSVDGIHPNALGEELMATRFQQVLEAVDCCFTGDDDVPVLQLVDAQWSQIGLPANPGNQDTVADIFDELPAGGYGNSWVVFAADEQTRAAAFAYERLALNSRMTQGRGYWVMQMVSPSVDIRMSAASRQVSLTPVSDCTTATDCASVALQGRSDRFQWNLIGYPLAVQTRFDQSRFTGTTGACSAGCSSSDAESNGMVHDVMWHYDSQVSGGYREIRGTDTLQPWDGLWAAVLPAASRTVPVWQVAP